MHRAALGNFPLESRLLRASPCRHLVREFQGNATSENAISLLFSFTAYRRSQLGVFQREIGSTRQNELEWSVNRCTMLIRAFQRVVTSRCIVISPIFLFTPPVSRTIDSPRMEKQSRKKKRPTTDIRRDIISTYGPGSTFIRGYIGYAI